MPLFAGGASRVGPKNGDKSLDPKMGTCHDHRGMRIIARSTLKRYWTTPGHADAEQPLKAWFAEVSAADWSQPAQVKDQFRSASIVGNGRVVFNIAGNKYRLVVRINYPYRVVYIRFVGTHQEYDQVDATTV
jgi:mRNA interferase HigB